MDNEAMILYYSQCLDRNRKYLQSYVLHRTSKIRELRWEIGSMIPDQIREKLSPVEIDYFSKYNASLNNFNSEKGVDLTSDVEVM
jgi:GINS complex subunit 1